MLGGTASRHAAPANRGVTAKCQVFDGQTFTEREVRDDERDRGRERLHEQDRARRRGRAVEPGDHHAAEEEDLSSCAIGSAATSDHTRPAARKPL